MMKTMSLHENTTCLKRFDDVSAIFLAYFHPRRGYPCFGNAFDVPCILIFLWQIIPDRK